MSGRAYGSPGGSLRELSVVHKPLRQSGFHGLAARSAGARASPADIPVSGSEAVYGARYWIARDFNVKGCFVEKFTYWKTST